MGKLTKELRAKLDELGIEYETRDALGACETSWCGCTAYQLTPESKLIMNPTPEQAIAATVGMAEDETDARDLTKAIRNDDGVRYSMDEVMEIMGEDVAAKVGNAQPSNAVIERIERFCTDYAQCLMDSTILVKRNYESMDRMALEKAEVVEDRLIRELAEDIVTAGAGTCHMEVCDNLDESEGMGDMWLECDKCHWQMPLEPTTPRFKYCPNCRRKVIKED